MEKKNEMKNEKSAHTIHQCCEDTLRKYKRQSYYVLYTIQHPVENDNNLLTFES